MSGKGVGVRTHSFPRGQEAGVAVEWARLHPGDGRGALAKGVGPQEHPGPLGIPEPLSWENRLQLQIPPTSPGNHVTCLSLFSSFQKA